MYIPGDVVVSGLYPIHLSGTKPLTCGDLYRDGAMLVEALRWTIRQVNSQNILKGVTLGGLVIDDCFSILKSLHEVTAIQRREMEVKDSNGNVLDPDTVDGYHGGFQTSLVLPVAELMKEIKRPQIAINPTSTEGKNYPYLIYTLYGVDKLVQAYVLMLKKVGWHHVQAIYDPDQFSRSYIKKFKEIAGKHGICLVASYELNSMMTGNDIVRKLQQYSTVQPVLTLTSEPKINGILASLKSLNGSGQFNLMTLLLGKTYNSFQGYKDVAMGTINIGYKKPDISVFRNYLSTLTPNTAGNTNPWFSEWYEHLYNCSLDSADMRKYTTVCDRDRSVGSAPDLVYHSSVTSAILGLRAYAFGLHNTLIELCGSSYNGLCVNFTNGANKGERLVEYIKKVSFLFDGKTSIKFNGGEINLPLEYYNWNSSSWVKVM